MGCNGPVLLSMCLEGSSQIEVLAGGLGLFAAPSPFQDPCLSSRERRWWPRDLRLPAPTPAWAEGEACPWRQGAEAAGLKPCIQEVERLGSMSRLRSMLQHGVISNAWRLSRAEAG